MEFAVGGFLGVLIYLFLLAPGIDGCNSRLNLEAKQKDKEAPKECRSKCLEYGQKTFLLNPRTHECLCRFE